MREWSGVVEEGVGDGDASTVVVVVVVAVVVGGRRCRSSVSGITDEDDGCGLDVVTIWNVGVSPTGC